MRCMYADGTEFEVGNCARCRCPRCLSGEDKFFYTVKPFEWRTGQGRHGTDGTSYSIVQQRTVGTSRCKEDADLIAAALNGAKKHERTVEMLRLKIECLESSRVSVNDTVAGVVTAMKEEVSQLSHCRWTRKQIIDFGKRVLCRIGATNIDIDRTSTQL